MNSNPFSKGLILLALLFFSQLAILAQPGDSLLVKTDEEDLLSLFAIGILSNVCTVELDLSPLPRVTE